ncbi:hypothetical protein MTAB308_213, partial [Mycobacterium terramassiliense]
LLTVLHDAESANDKDSGSGRSLFDEIVRDGARRMLAAALETDTVRACASVVRVGVSGRLTMPKMQRWRSR